MKYLLLYYDKGVSDCEIFEIHDTLDDLKKNIAWYCPPHEDPEDWMFDKAKFKYLEIDESKIKDIRS